MTSRTGRGPRSGSDTASRVARPHPPSASCVASVLDLLDMGVLMCSADGQVLMANQPARFELARGTLLQWQGPRHLAAANPESQAPLLQACADAARSGLRRLVPLFHHNERLLVAVQPPALPDPQCPCAVLLLGRRRMAPELAVEMLGSLFELTFAERRVLNGLLSGLRVAGLARLNGVAVSTVRTQVAALRAKFGVQRIDDVTRLVAEMPPLVSALRDQSLQR